MLLYLFHFWRFYRSCRVQSQSAVCWPSCHCVSIARIRWKPIQTWNGWLLHSTRLPLSFCSLTFQSVFTRRALAWVRPWMGQRWLIIWPCLTLQTSSCCSSQYCFRPFPYRHGRKKTIRQSPKVSTYWVVDIISYMVKFTGPLVAFVDVPDRY